MEVLGPPRLQRECKASLDNFVTFHLKIKSELKKLETQLSSQAVAPAYLRPQVQSQRGKSNKNEKEKNNNNNNERNDEACAYLGSKKVTISHLAGSYHLYHTGVSATPVFPRALLGGYHLALQPPNSTPPPTM